MENRDHHGHHGHYESSPANNTVMLAHGGDLRIWGASNQSRCKVCISFVYRGYEEKKASASAEVYSDWHVIVLYVFSSGVWGVYCVTYVVCRKISSVLVSFLSISYSLVLTNHSFHCQALEPGWNEPSYQVSKHDRFVVVIEIVCLSDGANELRLFIGRQNESTDGQNRREHQYTNISPITLIMLSNSSSLDTLELIVTWFRSHSIE
jgi:hypothetical protein